MVLVATFLAFGEADRISQQLPGAEGQVMSIGSMIGPSSATFATLWSAWDGTDLVTPGGVLIAHVAIDLVFIATYVSLALLAIRYWFPAPGMDAGKGPLLRDLSRTWDISFGGAPSDADVAVRREARARLRMLGALGLLLVVELVEAELLLSAAAELFAVRISNGDDRAGSIAFDPSIGLAIGYVEPLKAGLTVLFVSLLVVNPRFRHSVAGTARRFTRAVGAHSLSLVLVTLFVALSLVPPTVYPLFEQLPEVERAWLDQPSNGEVGTGHLIWALVTVAVFAFVAFVIGRKRSELYWEATVRRIGPGKSPRFYGKPTTRMLTRMSWPGPMRYLIWASPLALIPIAGDIVEGVGGEVDWNALTILWRTLAIFLLISIGLEIYFLRSGRILGKRVGGSDANRLRNARDVARAGDIIAGLVIGAGLLGVARSFTSPLIVQAAVGQTIDFAALALVVTCVAAAALAVAFAATRNIPLRRRRWAFADSRSGFGAPRSSRVAMQLMSSRRRRRTGYDGGWLTTTRLGRFISELRSELDPSTSERVATRAGLIVAALAGGLSFVILIALIRFPEQIGKEVGLVAVAVAALGSLSTLVGLAAAFFRLRRPLAIFEWVGLRADPMVAVLVALPLITAQLAGAPQLHAVDRIEGAEATQPRLSLQDAFKEWVTGMAGCADDEGRVPLVVVAAEGGGIRAAAWTDAVLAQFARDGQCAADSIFLSSGVSGGSVGLAVAATVNERPADADPNTEPLEGAAYADELEARISALSDGTTLPAGVAGLVVSDPLASLTGLRIPTSEDADAAHWRDRASLIEDSWRNADGSLLESTWDVKPTAPTGYVVFNSADILSGCRVSISQVDLGVGTTGSTIFVVDDQPRCDQGSAGPPLTLDLLELYETQDCPFAADWATASMLSARFPVVTPGGVIDFGTFCERDPIDGKDADQPRLHLVDGGYAENSGVGLIADIAPALGEIIRTHNATASSADSPLVVPYLVYIQNSPGADLIEPRRDQVPELIVPILGGGTAAYQNAPATLIQRALNGFGRICPTPTPTPTPTSTSTPTPTPDPSDSVEEPAEPVTVAPCDSDPPELSTGSRVVLAAVSTDPATAVPLGWSLSHDTLVAYFTDAELQAANCQAPAWSEYRCLEDLLDRLPGG